MLTRLYQILPHRIAEAVAECSAMVGGRIEEVRLYRDGGILLLVGGQCIRVGESCCAADFDETVRRLCGNSLYAHEETIREGFIFSEGGFRVGICGNAVVRDHTIERITSFTSLCIRIPSRYPNLAEDVIEEIVTPYGVRGMLIYAPPGVGKTTLLRELAVSFSAPPHTLRCAVVDTRYEICSGISCEMLDVLRGYPRAIGMEIAVRTMSPQLVICDEIAQEAEADAAFQCATSGCAVIASAHGASLEALQKNPAIRRLIAQGIFPTFVGLRRENGHVIQEITHAV